MKTYFVTKEELLMGNVDLTLMTKARFEAANVDVLGEFVEVIVVDKNYAGVVVEARKDRRIEFLLKILRINADKHRAEVARLKGDVEFWRRNYVKPPTKWQKFKAWFQREASDH